MLRRYFTKIFREIKYQKLKIAFVLSIAFIYKLGFSNKQELLPNKTINFLDENVQTFDYLNQYKRIKSFKEQFVYTSKWKKVLSKQRNLRYNQSKDFLILEYTKIFSSTKYCQKFGADQFDQNTNFESVKRKLFLNECQFTNCVFSCDKRRLNEANALIFHQADLEVLVQEDRLYLENLRMSLKQREEQIWILWNDEANRVNKDLDEFGFNWTMSYRTDSEISDCSYGCIYRKINKDEENFYQKVKKYFDFKRNSAVWFVSNCESKFRISFAKSLREYFPVEIFGACSVYFRSFFDRLFGESKKCTRDSGCEYEKLISNKFYLSFESKNCSNYLTEKVWKMLHIGIIPVVIQPSKQFYELNLPPNSFIHAQDFNFEPEKLATYLEFVSNDFDAFYSYLKWKLDYQVVFSAFQTERRRLCELCTKLNNEDSIIFYTNVSEFFNHQCIIN
ncbi:alpha-(1-3)-fucosyltransferase 4 [Brachionus plicatilis]|uniref:Fucosyltransferase n=1 Tax=Brachionus plicatilis TaxID=10195 RepID=A0A3M7Q696_BRAPC|nr:alpha-(1-3)-fucosyltransferase 4 [Brachionus plicatilis]